MKKLVVYAFILLGMALSANKCNESKKGNEDIIRDKTGVVIDRHNLDGCGFLIQLDNGTKLEPIEVTPEFEFTEGQRIKVSYQHLEGVASTCMAGELVRITEIKSIKN